MWIQNKRFVFNPKNQYNHMTQELFESVDGYISQLFGGEDKDLLNAERAIEESGIPQISISPNQGKFLHVLARLCRARRILEVGTLGGYSTIWMARDFLKMECL